MTIQARQKINTDFVPVILVFDRSPGLNCARHVSKQVSSVLTSESAQKLEDASFEDLLIDIGANRNKQAFAVVFEYFAPRLKSFLMRSGLSPDQAEELAQETMLAVWHKASNFNPDKASASTWLYTIARNKKIDLFRKNDRPEPDPNDPYFQENVFNAQDDTISASRESDQIVEAMKSLPQEQANLVHMAFFEEKTHQEIAEKTGIALGTVKSRIRLALQKLETALKGQIELD